MRKRASVCNACILRTEGLEVKAQAQDTQTEPVSRFLECACPDHHVRGLPAHRMARHAAMRILQENPDIARESICTAVVCGHVHAPCALVEQPIPYFNSGCWTELPCTYLTAVDGLVELREAENVERMEEEVVAVS